MKPVRVAHFPTHELAESDEGVPICILVEDVPIHADVNSGEAYIHADNHVPEEDPTRDEVVVFPRGGLLFSFRSGGLKPKAVAGKPSVTKFTHSS